MFEEFFTAAEANRRQARLDAIEAEEKARAAAAEAEAKAAAKKQRQAARRKYMAHEITAVARNLGVILGQQQNAPEVSVHRGTDWAGILNRTVIIGRPLVSGWPIAEDYRLFKPQTGYAGSYKADTGEPIVPSTPPYCRQLLVTPSGNLAIWRATLQNDLGDTGRMFHPEKNEEVRGVHIGKIGVMRSDYRS
ncbi:MAG TPA: hypothetical protein VMR45_04155 [Patescibacteria group bacterium]|nr:hypothetical protein [Patescibacteria group bacterium]